jgi:tRNA U34 5-carboxymethylaminomethyl modifying enzyme MnmG/GidA
MEPYRMFTSRAEHRLLLRADNADARLTPLAALAGLVPKTKLAAWETKRALVEEGVAALAAAGVAGHVLLREGLVERAAGGPRRADRVLAMPGVGLGDVERMVAEGAKEVGMVAEGATEIEASGAMLRGGGDVERMVAQGTGGLGAGAEEAISGVGEAGPGMWAEAEGTMIGVRPAEAEGGEAAADAWAAEPAATVNLATLPSRSSLSPLLSPCPHPLLVAPVARETVEVLVKYDAFIKRQEVCGARLPRGIPEPPLPLTLIPPTPHPQF